MRSNRKDLPDKAGIISIHIPDDIWSGPENPNPKDDAPLSIKVFDGIGMDGDGDGKAEVSNDEDILYTFSQYLLSYGTDEDNIRIGLWHYYRRDQTVGIISEFMKLFKAYGHIDSASMHSRFRSEPITAIEARGEMPAASEEDGFMKVRISLPITAFLSNPHVTALSK